MPAPLIHRSPLEDVHIPEVPVTEIVLRHAEQRANKPALIEGLTGRSITYGTMAEEVRRLAGGLKSRGFGNGDVLAHELLLYAGRFTPINRNLIPTGELRSVEGTPLDFGKSTPIGGRIADSYEQLELAEGYDHNFVLDRDGPGLRPAARVHEPSTGRILEVHTTEPAVQFYSGNFLDGTLTGKQCRVYKRRRGFCLETQHYPDSVNHPEFPSTILPPGQTYHSLTVHRFSVDTA